MNTMANRPQNGSYSQVVVYISTLHPHGCTLVSISCTKWLTMYDSLEILNNSTELYRNFILVLFKYFFFFFLIIGSKRNSSFESSCWPLNFSLSRSFLRLIFSNLFRLSPSLITNYLLEPTQIFNLNLKI